MSEELSNLRRRLADIQIEIDNLPDIKRRLSDECVKIRQKIEKLEYDEKHPPDVTDHALVRWFERYYKLDIDSVRKEILNNAVVDLINKNPNGSFDYEGMHYKIKERKIVTLFANQSSIRKEKAKKNNTSKGCFHIIIKEGDIAICETCRTDFGWYCDENPTNYCEYGLEGEDCIFCGEPEERQ